MTGRRWTKEEDTLITERWGKDSIKRIALRLNRTESSVKYRASCNLHLGSSLSMYAKNNIITFSKLMKIITKHKPNQRIKNSFLKYGFPFKRITASNSKVLCVDLYDLWKWMAKYPDKINLKYTEKGDLGIEPAWITSKRFKDKKIIKKKAWTDKELELLSICINDGKSGPEIAKELGRSEDSIAAKAASLKLSIPRKRPFWTKSDENIMLKLYSEGRSIKDMCKILNRSRNGVSRKLHRLLKEN